MWCRWAVPVLLGFDGDVEISVGTLYLQYLFHAPRPQRRAGPRILGVAGRGRAKALRYNSVVI